MCRGYVQVISEAINVHLGKDKNNHRARAPHRSIYLLFLAACRSIVTLASSQQQLSRSHEPDLSTNEFYGQAPKFPQHLLLSDRTSHIHAAIEEGHYFKVGINPELQLSKFKQQSINFSRLALIDSELKE